MGLEEMAAGPTTHFQDSQGTTGPRGRDTGHRSHKGQHRHLRGQKHYASHSSQDGSFRGATSDPFCILPFDPKNLLKERGGVGLWRGNHGLGLGLTAGVEGLGAPGLIPWLA